MICRTGPAVPVLSILLLGVLWSTTVPSGAQAGPGTLTNLALMDQLTREAAVAVADSIGLAPGAVVTLMPAAGHEASEFVGEALANEFARRGIKTRIAVAGAAVEEPARTQPRQGGAQNEERSGAVQDERSAPEEGRSDGASTGSAGSLDPGSTLGFGADADTAKADTTGFWAADSLEQARERARREREEAREEATDGGGSAGAAGTESATESSGTSRPPQVKAYPDGLVVEYRVLEFGVTYPSFKRRFIVFGDPSVRRLGGVYIQANKIEGPSGTIMGTYTGQSHYEDRLSARSRALAEGASYPFAKPAVPPSSITRIVEPVVVVAIVSSLVYLFYQNQN